MARPEKNSVEYFPFYCEEGKTTFIIEEKHGNDGFATWIKLLRTLAITNYHFINLSDKPTVMFLVSKCKVSEEKFFAIIKDLVDLGEFDRQLWEENQVIFNQKFIESIKDAYLKRTNNIAKREEVITILEGLGVRKHTYDEVKGVDNTYTILDNTILEKSKVDLDGRKLKFASSLEIHLEKYGKVLLNEFYKYWTEPNKSKTKLRWELEKTWDVARRLERWSRNDKNFNNKKEVPAENKEIKWDQSN